MAPGTAGWPPARREGVARGAPPPLGDRASLPVLHAGHPRLALEVEELHAGDHHDAQAEAAADLVAQVHVVEVDGKDLAEAARPLVGLARDRRAGGRHSADLAVDGTAAELAQVGARPVEGDVVVVPVGVAVTDVLDGVVAEVQLGAGHADVGLVEGRHQLLEPPFGPDLDVVVEQDDPVAGGGDHAEVHLPAEVELLLRRQDRHQTVAEQLAQLGHHRLGRGLVVDDDDLEVLVLGVRQQRADGLHDEVPAEAPHQARRAPRGDHDRDAACGVEAAGDRVEARHRALPDRPRRCPAGRGGPAPPSRPRSPRRAWR